MQTPRAILTYSGLVGWCLRRRRREKGLTQATLAKACGVSASAWSRLESGDSVLTVPQLHLAARLVGLSPLTVLRQADHLVMALVAGGFVVDWGDGKALDGYPAKPAAFSALLATIRGERLD